MASMGPGGWLGDVGRDVRYALRTLRKSPAFALVAVLCLGLGIGANAAIFSVVDAVLLRPVAFPEPDTLVRVYETQPGRGKTWTGSVSWPNFRDWAAQTRAFSHLAAVDGQSRNLGPSGGGGGGEAGEGAERLAVTATTGELFGMLRVQPLLGRAFGPEEDGPGAPSVVVLGEGLWRRRFGADPAVVGRSVVLDGVSHTVLGVVPAAFRFPATASPDAYVPFVPPPQVAERRDAHMLEVYGRLAPGASLTQANAELRSVSERLEAAHPVAQAGRSAEAQGLADTLVRRARPALLVLLGAVGLLLLIACANVANLLLARAAGRRQEVAVRLALGASRGRLVRQLLAESFLLAGAGAALGLLLARWGLDALGALTESALPLARQASLDGRVLLFLLAVAGGSALLFGLVPALQATRGDVSGGLVGGGKSTAAAGQKRLRGALVVGEIALSLVLLVGAGLLLRAFVTLLGTDPGLEPRGVLTARLALPPPPPEGAPQGEPLMPRVLERVRALPGVQAAGIVSLLPIQRAWSNNSYTVPGEPPPRPGEEPLAEMRMTSPGLFAALGVPLLAGRELTEADGAATGDVPVVVNRALARRHFGEESPVGRRLLLGGEAPVVIVGMVGDVRQAGLHEAPLAEMHAPYNFPLAVRDLREVSVVLKTSMDPGSLGPALRGAVRAVDGGASLYQVLTMEEVIARSVSQRRLTLLLLGTFAALALVLAAAGLFGVISYLVAQRTRELGIRMALGAQAGDVVRLVVGQGAALTGLGLGLGLLASLALSRVLESQLDGLSARDPLTFLALPALLGAVSLLAAWLPARRAARVDPTVALRGE
jgi:predicted permease